MWWMDKKQKKKKLERKSTGAIERMSSIETEESGTRMRKTIEKWKTKRHGEVDTNVSSRTTASSCRWRPKYPRGSNDLALGIRDR